MRLKPSARFSTPLCVLKPTVWELRRHVTVSAFLLATVLNPSEPREAERRLALLERASGVLTSHAAKTQLSVQDAELLKKIEALRDATSAAPPETVWDSASSR